MSDYLTKRKINRHILYILFFCLLFSSVLHSNATEIPYSENHLSQNEDFLLMNSGTCQSLPIISTDPLSMYFSSDPDVVSVSESGILTAHNTGTAQILYTGAGHLYHCDIQVSESDTFTTISSKPEKNISFSLKDSLLFMEPGDSYKGHIRCA